MHTSLADVRQHFTSQTLYRCPQVGLVGREYLGQIETSYVLDSVLKSLGAQRKIIRIP